jgi:hypothetical protein
MWICRCGKKLKNIMDLREHIIRKHKYAHVQTMIKQSKRIE